MMLTMSFATLTLLLLPLSSIAQSTNDDTNTIVSIPNEYTYNLPAPFTTNSTLSFVSSTSTSNTTLNTLFATAAKAPFTSYSSEFTALLGPSPKITHVTSTPNQYTFYESGAWVPPPLNRVYFSSSPSQYTRDNPIHLTALDLDTGRVYEPNTSVPLHNTNGGVYHDGKVWFTQLPGYNEDEVGGVVSLDPVTGRVETVVNSYFGGRFGGADDLVWVRSSSSTSSAPPPQLQSRSHSQPEEEEKSGSNNNGKDILFFTNLATVLSTLGLVAGLFPSGNLPAGVWRFSPSDQRLDQVISRADIALANGIRASPDGRKLYITDIVTTAQFAEFGGGAPAIYQYDLVLDEGGELGPVNRRLFAGTRDAVADGMHVDDRGRVWTAEGGGIVVRDAQGRVLGEVNGDYFTKGGLAISNFALAGDVLVVGGVTELWTVRLGVVVVKGDE